MIFQLKAIEMENLNTLKEATSFTHEIKKNNPKKTKPKNIRFGV